MDKYIHYNSTTDLHRELTNILLLSVEENSSIYYCYCGEEFGTCGLCQLTYFFADPYKENTMDGLPPRKFLAKNYNKRQKLEEFSAKILPFFEKIEKDHLMSLDFFKNEYSWSLKQRSTGNTLSLTLDEVIENEILDFIDNKTVSLNLDESVTD